MRTVRRDRLTRMLLRPQILLRLEGLAALAAAAWGYTLTGASGGLFALVFFVPDLSVAGYLAGPRAGAAVYNAAHTFAAPAVAAALAVATGWTIGVPVALIWAAHIGFDRALGYGLKLPEAFHQTHLGAIGAARDA